MSRSSRRLLAACLVLLPAFGCGATGPRWLQPGPASFQRAEAQRFDPYPEPDAGPPIMGGRPREYENPIAEPSRARWNPISWMNR